MRFLGLMERHLAPAWITRSLIGPRCVFALAILLSQITFAQDRRFPPPPPPPPSRVATYTVGNYNIHIYENPGARTRNYLERSVLLLGTFSNPEAVLRSQNFINPATNRRYDVIIGLAADNVPAEARRVVLQDHFNADRNAAALRTALTSHFGQPLAARTLDTHSNGTTVGIAGILQGAFQQVRQLNVMGPDIGYGGVYFNTQTLSRLRGAGVETVDIYRNRGDIIPALGQLTGLLGKSVPAINLAEQVNKSLQALTTVSTGAGATALPEVRQFQLQTSLGFGFQNHYVENYLNIRAGLVKDPGAGAPLPTAPTDVKRTAETLDRLVKIPPPMGPTDAKGVRIYIDDEVLTRALAAASSRENEQMFAALAERLSSVSDEKEIDGVLGDFADQIKLRFKNSRAVAKLDNLTLVSIKSLLNGSAAYVQRWNELPESLKHPGRITRIHGYIRNTQDEDILLIGESNPNEPPIELDDLIVGINAVWKEGFVPFCSLDPDPDNIAGAQKVRLDGVPLDSGFGLKMLDADYAMKKIMFGIEPVEVPGYSSYKSIIASRRSTNVSTNRFWLYPIQPELGQIQISADMNSAIFLGGVQVLSEQMVQTREGFVGTGQIDAEADQAASLFTRHYQEIARSKPEFQRLQALFDIVLLARIWRHINLQSPLLDRLSQLPHRPVNISQSYPGLQAKVFETQDVLVTLSGGVQARAAASARSLLAFDDPEFRHLQARAREQSTGSGPAFNLKGSSVKVVAPDRARRDAVSLATTMAMSRLAGGDLRGALNEISNAVRANPYDPEPLSLRAFINFLAGDIPAARSDAWRAQQIDPENPDALISTSVVLFQCDVLEGKPEAAMQKIDWALRHDPGSVRSRILRAEALMQLERSAEAREELNKALAMDPTSALAYARLGLLEITEGWIAKGRRLIRKAYAISSALKQDGPEIKVALALAEMSAAAYGNVESQLSIAEKAAQDALNHPACDPRSALGGLIVLSGIAMIREDWVKAEQYIQRARELAPATPELLIYAAELALELKREDLARKYLGEAERLAPQLPAVQALRKKVGR
jgi:Flp pilus assembly protein TadD